MIEKYVVEGKYGQFCAANAECTKVAMMAMTTANAAEAKEIQNWLHPTASLQNLGFFDFLKEKAAAAKADVEAFNHKEAERIHAFNQKMAADYHHYAPIVEHDGEVAIKDIELAG